MKELSIEEKSKRYDEAIERAKYYYDEGKTLEYANDIVSDIFPELKESEDERIRKEICKLLWDNAPYEEAQEYIAWLEKQGEQKSDKVEPKFRNGQWLVWQDKCYKVNYNGCGYELVDQDGLSTSLEYGTVDENAHIWDITKDAKAGDVLVCKGNIKNSNGIKYERICLFNNIDNAFFTLTKTSNYVEEYDIDVNIDYPDNTVPATKEQKEILFMAMADAGYTFDFEKKELKKIVDEEQIKKNLQDNNFRRMFEQKPANNQFTPEQANILDKHIDKYLEQKPVEWSEKDERMYRGLHNLIYSTPYCDSRKELSDWLQSLKDRVQPKQEWSGEDEKVLHAIRNALNYEKPRNYLKSRDFEFTDILDWLKSLRPQSQWKPSLAQLNALSIVSKGNAPDDIEAIVSLYQDLKKLREE